MCGVYRWRRHSGLDVRQRQADDVENYRCDRRAALATFLSIVIWFGSKSFNIVFIITRMQKFKIEKM